MIRWDQRPMLGSHRPTGAAEEYSKLRSPCHGEFRIENEKRFSPLRELICVRHIIFHSSWSSDYEFAQGHRERVERAIEGWLVVV